LRGYLLLAQKQYANKSLEGAYNFGPNDESCVTNGTLADFFCTAWGESASWLAESDGGPHEANFLKLDCSRSKSILGWKPEWDIKTAIEKVVEFAKAGSDDERLSFMKRQIREYPD
jgi:CDP-glucose 4,6-dehydratase